jgi:hypothetical protein
MLIWGVDMVRQYLKQVVTQDRRRFAAWERVQHLLDAPAVRIGGSLPSRDELHER